MSCLFKVSSKFIPLLLLSVILLGCSTRHTPIVETKNVSFETDSQCYKYDSGRSVFCNGDILYVGNHIYRFENDKYIRSELDPQLVELLYNDANGYYNYSAVLQYQDCILWTLWDGRIILYNDKTNEIETIQTGLRNIVSPCIYGDFLYGISNNTLFRINLSKRLTDYEYDSPSPAFHNIVMGDAGEIYMQSIRTIDKDTGSVERIQRDVRYDKEEEEVLAEYPYRDGTWRMDAVDDGKLYYTFSSFDGDVNRFFEVDDHSRREIEVSDNNTKLLSIYYSKYVDDGMIIAVPTMEYDLSIVPSVRVALENKIYCFDINGKIEKTIPYYVDDNERMIYHCYRNGIIYIFVENTEDLSVSLEAYTI